MIGRIRSFVPQSTPSSVFIKIIQPHFDYGSLVWNISNAYSIQRVQDRAARVISGKAYEMRSEAILQKLGWQSLSHRWEQNKSKFMICIKLKIVNF